MAKVKDLAKELGVPNDAVLDQLRNLYVEVEDENSQVDPKIAALVKIKLGGFKPAEPEKPKKEKPKKEPKAGKEKAKKEEAEEGGEKEKKPRKKKKAEAAGEEEKKAEVKVEKKKKEEKKKEEKKEEEKAPEEEVKTEEEEVKPAAPPASPIRVVKRASEIEKETKETTKATVRKIRRVVKPVPVAKKPGKKVKKEEAGEEKGRPGKRPRQEPVKKEKRTAPGPATKPVFEMPEHTGPLQKLQVQVPSNIRALASKIDKKPNELLQYMMHKGAFVNINQDLDEDVVRALLADFGYELELPPSIEEELMAEHTAEEIGGKQEGRAPIVTFMGHVDHGKTSLLDYIRNTMVASREKGGITQHIGAYRVITEKGSVTFLDTPGHEAFTAMRARGASATDVVVLVVAADDGVMPQTKEAIDHARAAGVPIVVAINKCDLPGADPGRVKQELQKEGLSAEDWGGETVMVEVSAKTGEGVPNLVEMLMLESELLELKAAPSLRARGVVLEGRKTPGQGIVASVLVKNGTLRSGDLVLTGIYYGKIKAMINDRGERVTEASPATPVEILGLQGVPQAGDEFFVVKDEKKARTLSLIKQGENKRKGMAGSQRVTLEDLHSRIVEGSMKELNIILKADVQGSNEALQDALKNLATSEVKVKVVHSAVGNINESDVMLAMVSNAIIIGFHVKVDQKAEDLAKAENIDIHVYDVIYEAIDEVKAGMEGLLEPEEKEIIQGRAQVKEVFSATKIGKVAGCTVLKGVIHRKDRVRVRRGDEVIFDGQIDNLKRFKDDVKDVREGFECGISLKNFTNINKNDIIEAYTIEKIVRKLDKK